MPCRPLPVGQTFLSVIPTAVEGPALSNLQSPIPFSPVGQTFLSVILSGAPRAKSKDLLSPQSTAQPFNQSPPVARCSTPLPLSNLQSPFSRVSSRSRRRGRGTCFIKSPISNPLLPSGTDIPVCQASRSLGTPFSPINPTPGGLALRNTEGSKCGGDHRGRGMVNSPAGVS